MEGREKSRRTSIQSVNTTCRWKRRRKKPNNQLTELAM
jgi:hypothetical protein